MFTVSGLGRNPVPGEQLQPAQTLGGDPVLPAPRRLEPAVDVAVEEAPRVRGLGPLAEAGHRQGSTPLLMEELGAAQGLLAVSGQERLAARPAAVRVAAAPGVFAE